EAMTMADRVAAILGGQIIQTATPQQIYDAPADLRVAEFIGTPKINVLAGELRAAGGVEALGTVWPISVAGAETGRVSIGVRAEAWELDCEPGHGPRAAATWGGVRHLEHRGAEPLVLLGLNEGSLPFAARVEPAAAAGLSIGAVVAASAKTERVLLFDGRGKLIPLRNERSARLQVAN